MSDILIESIVAGKIPGTSVDIEFDAFLQGLLVGMICYLVLRTAFAVTVAFQNKDVITSYDNPRATQIEFETSIADIK